MTTTPRTSTLQRRFAATLAALLLAVGLLWPRIHPGAPVPIITVDSSATFTPKPPPAPPHDTTLMRGCLKTNVALPEDCSYIILDTTGGKPRTFGVDAGRIGHQPDPFALPADVTARVQPGDYGTTAPPYVWRPAMGDGGKAVIRADIAAARERLAWFINHKPATSRDTTPYGKVALRKFVDTMSTATAFVLHPAP